MALLAQRAEAEGYSLKEIGQAYGTKNRKTIRDLLDYTVTDFDYTPPGRTKELHHYFDVIEVGDGRVTIKTNEPVPINLWEVADAPNDWEGSVTTDGAISDEYNVLWKELRSTNLPFLLGIRDLFDQ